MSVSSDLRFLVYLGLLVAITVAVRIDEGSGEEPEQTPEQTLEQTPEQTPEQTSEQTPEPESEWNENPDYGESHHRACPEEHEILGLKHEVKQLRTSIEALRTKLDPDFKATPEIEKSSKKCPHGFYYLPKTRGCYRIVYEEHNWTSADDRCRQMNPDAHLVAITTSTENDALVRYLRWDLQINSHRNICLFHDWGDKQKMLWTSGHRRNDDCQEPFVWQLSPIKHQSLAYSQWALSEPNCWSRREKCLHIRPSESYQWNDIGCDRKLCPVCEYDPKTTN